MKNETVLSNLRPYFKVLRGPEGPEGFRWVLNWVQAGPWKGSLEWVLRGPRPLVQVGP